MTPNTQPAPSDLISPRMKRNCFLHASLAGAALAAPLAADPITPEEISARHKSPPAESFVQMPADAGAKAANPAAEVPVKPSDVLSDGLNWTLVPRGAVLHIPLALSNRVDAKPIGNLLSWDDFLTVNRGWLFTEEVTPEQAAGKAPIPPSRTEVWRKVGKVIVAVHLGGPVSIPADAGSPVATAP